MTVIFVLVSLLVSDNNCAESSSVSIISDAGRLADMIAGHLNLKLEERQELLECIDVKARLEKLYGVLKRERDILDIEREAYGRGFVDGGDEAWRILAPLLDEVVANKIFKLMPERVIEAVPEWDHAKEWIIEFIEAEKRAEMEKKIKSFVDYMSNCGYDCEDVFDILVKRMEEKK